jgi:hypothetical protein
MSKISFILACALLSACTAVDVQRAEDVLNALPDLSPQGQCEQGGGHYRSVTTYENGKTSTVYQCIQESPK